jgi:hypothetical protein
MSRARSIRPNSITVDIRRRNLCPHNDLSRPANEDSVKTNGTFGTTPLFPSWFQSSFAYYIKLNPSGIQTSCMYRLRHIVAAINGRWPLQSYA